MSNWGMQVPYQAHPGTQMVAMQPGAAMQGGGAGYVVCMVPVPAMQMQEGGVAGVQGMPAMQGGDGSDHASGGAVMANPGAWAVPMMGGCAVMPTAPMQQPGLQPSGQPALPSSQAHGAADSGTSGGGGGKGNRHAAAGNFGAPGATGESRADHDSNWRGTAAMTHWAGGNQPDTGKGGNRTGGQQQPQQQQAQQQWISYDPLTAKPVQQPGMQPAAPGAARWGAGNGSNNAPGSWADASAQPFVPGAAQREGPQQGGGKGGTAKTQLSATAQVWTPGQVSNATQQVGMLTPGLQSTGSAQATPAQAAGGAPQVEKKKVLRNAKMTTTAPTRATPQGSVVPPGAASSTSAVAPGSKESTSVPGESDEGREDRPQVNMSDKEKSSLQAALGTFSRKMQQNEKRGPVRSQINALNLEGVRAPQGPEIRTDKGRSEQEEMGMSPSNEGAATTKSFPQQPNQEEPLESQKALPASREQPAASGQQQQQQQQQQDAAAKPRTWGPPARVTAQAPQKTPALVGPAGADAAAGPLAGASQWRTGGAGGDGRAAWGSTGAGAGAVIVSAAAAGFPTAAPSVTNEEIAQAKRPAMGGGEAKKYVPPAMRKKMEEEAALKAKEEEEIRQKEEAERLALQTGFPQLGAKADDAKEAETDQDQKEEDKDDEAGGKKAESWADRARKAATAKPKPKAVVPAKGSDATPAPAAEDKKPSAWGVPSKEVARSGSPQPTASAADRGRSGVQEEAPAYAEEAEAANDEEAPAIDSEVPAAAERAASPSPEPKEPKKAWADEKDPSDDGEEHEEEEEEDSGLPEATLAEAEELAEEVVEPSEIKWPQPQPQQQVPSKAKAPSQAVLKATAKRVPGQPPAEVAEVKPAAPPAKAATEATEAEPAPAEDKPSGPPSWADRMKKSGPASKPKPKPVPQVKTGIPRDRAPAPWAKASAKEEAEAEAAAKEKAEEERRQQEEAERQRQEEEEAERLRKEEEEREEEERLKREEEERIAAEEAQRLKEEEDRRLAEEARLAEERRLAEEARKEAERKEAERKEAERKEAERKEAERKEAEKREKERLEAERKEAARIEAERKEAERKRKQEEEARRKEEERLERERKEEEARQEAERLRKEKEEEERLRKEKEEEEERERERVRQKEERRRKEEEAERERQRIAEDEKRKADEEERQRKEAEAKLAEAPVEETLKPSKGAWVPKSARMRAEAEAREKEAAPEPAPKADSKKPAVEAPEPAPAEEDASAEAPAQLSGSSFFAKKKGGKLKKAGSTLSAAAAAPEEPEETVKVPPTIAESKSPVPAASPEQSDDEGQRRQDEDEWARHAHKSPKSNMQVDPDVDVSDIEDDGSTAAARNSLLYYRFLAVSTPQEMDGLCALKHSSGYEAASASGPARERESRTDGDNRSLIGANYQRRESGGRGDDRDRRGDRRDRDRDRDRRDKGSAQQALPAPSENAYKILGKKEDLAHVEALRRKVQSILNKICPENEAISTQAIINEVEVTSAEDMKELVKLLYKKALAEPHYCVTYASLAQSLKEAYSTVEFPPDENATNGKKRNFKSILLTVVQDEFEKLFDEKNKREEEEKLKNMEPEEKEDRKMREKKQVLANMKFIGNLYLRQLLAAKITASIIDQLLGTPEQSPEEHIIECVCELLNSIGSSFEDQQPHGKHCITQSVGRLTELKSKKEKGKAIYSKRIQFTIQDVLDARKNGWSKRSFQLQAKTKEEIAKEQDRDAKALAAGKKVDEAHTVVAGERPQASNARGTSSTHHESSEWEVKGSKNEGRRRS